MAIILRNGKEWNRMGSSRNEWEEVDGTDIPMQRIGPTITQLFRIFKGLGPPKCTKKICIYFRDLVMLLDF